MAQPSPKKLTREQQAAQIASNPQRYKICHGCDSIVAHSAAMCPNCHSFRFDNNPTRIIDHAIRLGQREQSTVTTDDFH